MTSDTRPATLKYFTDGSSGVAGLNSSFRYLDVRLAYAGESRSERSKAVNDEGNDKRETALDFGDSDFCDEIWIMEGFSDPSFPSPRYS